MDLRDSPLLKAEAPQATGANAEIFQTGGQLWSLLRAARLARMNSAIIHMTNTATMDTDQPPMKTAG
ncbi:hypothetical protein AB0J63_44975 [Streptosporangium canum]|uniref:hypothetical protein n=1 Tax=Streptosporangium canum TaxID=324952 RepID=UPI00344560F2